MSIQSITYTHPLPDLSTAPYKIFRWYAKYSAYIRSNPSPADPERFYSSKCTMLLPDHTSISGGVEMWKFFMGLYTPFYKVERTILTLTLVPREEDEEWDLHYEGITTVFPTEGGEGIAVPQSFCYVIGKAEEGKGTDGLQFVGLRNYYDRGVLGRALEQIPKN